MHIPPEAEAILKFLGAVAGFIFTVVGGYKRIADGSRKKAADAVEREYKVDDEPKTPLQSEADLVRSLRAQLDEQERLHSAEARTLRRQVREMQDSIDELKADLIVATNERLKAERHGSEIVRQWRAAQGLKSDAPPANPLSASAKTVPPKR